MLINISILLIIVQHIFILLIYYDMEDINPDIRKTVAGLIRKRALNLYSLEDDSELREIFEPVVESKQESIFLHY